MPNLRDSAVDERSGRELFHSSVEPSILNVKGLVATAQDDVERITGAFEEASIVGKVGTCTYGGGCKSGCHCKVDFIDQLIVGPGRYIYIRLPSIWVVSPCIVRSGQALIGKECNARASSDKQNTK